MKKHHKLAARLRVNAMINQAKGHSSSAPNKVAKKLEEIENGFLLAERENASFKTDNILSPTLSWITEEFI